MNDLQKASLAAIAATIQQNPTPHALADAVATIAAAMVDVVTTADVVEAPAEAAGTDTQPTAAVVDQPAAEAMPSVEAPAVDISPERRQQIIDGARHMATALEEGDPIAWSIMGTILKKDPDAVIGFFGA